VAVGPLGGLALRLNYFATYRFLAASGRMTIPSA
jgi:hypothetical protein